MIINKVTAKNQASPFEEAFFYSPETYVHPTAIIGSGVSLGVGVKVGPYAVINGNVHIGDYTRIYHHVSVGGPAQSIGVMENLGVIVIGAYNEIREFVSIHSSKFPDGKTVIGDHCYIMAYSHISHDVQLGDYVTLTNGVNLGGHTVVEDRAVLMANAATHQWCRIGQYAALSPFSAIRQDLPPYGLYVGQPARYSALNVIALRRAGISKTSHHNLKKIMTLFYQDDLSLDELSTKVDNEAMLHGDEHVAHFMNFVRHSIHHGRGVSRRVARDA